MVDVLKCQATVVTLGYYLAVARFLKWLAI